MRKNTIDMPASLIRYLIGKEYVGRVNAYENKYIAAVQAEEEEYLKNHKLNRKTEIAEELAVLCNVSPYTISTYGNYAKGIDELREKNSTLANQILKGETKATLSDVKKLIMAL